MLAVILCWHYFSYFYHKNKTQNSIFSINEEENRGRQKIRIGRKHQGLDKSKLCMLTKGSRRQVKMLRSKLRVVSGTPTINKINLNHSLDKFTLIFHANCLQQFEWNIKAYFLGKIWKNVCWKFYQVCLVTFGMIWSLMAYSRKVREKSRECHNHKPQPFPDPKRKRKLTNLNKHKPNKRTKSTKISSLFPKRGNRNTKRTEKHKNKMTHGKTYNKSPLRVNHKATKSKTNTGTTTLERSVEQTSGGFKALLQLANFTLGPDAILNTVIHKNSVRVKAPNSVNASKRKHKNQINHYTLEIQHIAVRYFAISSISRIVRGPQIYHDHKKKK